MRIAMFTNTFLPHVGGVARSVSAFAGAYRTKGHEVLVVAPEFEDDDQAQDDADVVRIPAIQNFNGSDFSVALVAPGWLDERLDGFSPQIIHSHHPFLLGNEAVRVAQTRELPLVVTHHTLYEQYTHYVPADSSILRRFVIELATCYANLCDHVFAPSGSIAELIVERGVRKPVTVVPTGVDYDFFKQGNGPRLRGEHSIDDDTFVVGHVGRLAPEKNLGFLADAVVEFIRETPAAFFLLAGAGPSEAEVLKKFESAGLEDKVLSLGELDHDELRDVYSAMDIFVFASQSETQGMVLAEAMATGTPVIALDASGVRDIVEHGINGRLLADGNRDAFVQSLQWYAGLDDTGREEFRKAARRTAKAVSLSRCADRALAVYETLVLQNDRSAGDYDAWRQVVERVSAEWKIISSGARALGTATLDQLVDGKLEEDADTTR